MPRIKLTAIVVLIVAAICLAGCGELSGDASSNDPDAATVTVPDVVDLDGSDAESQIEDAELTVTFAASTDDEDIGEPRPDATGCKVVDQDPSGDDEVDPDTDVSLELDCRQTDWENQDGDEWDDYQSQFDNAVDEGCDAVFTSHLSLYDNDQEYSSLDCASISAPDAADDVPGDVPDDPSSAGSEAGFDAGCVALFDSVGTDALFYGEDSVTADDCQASNPYRSASAGRGDSDSAQGECVGSVAGKSFTIELTAGSVPCAKARSTWIMYSRRAPREGAGSSAALNVGKWLCSSASPTEAPRLGTCSSSTRKTEFRAIANE